MKKLFVILLGLIFISSAFAYDTANLRIRITGPIKDNSYFLCVPNTGGCVSVYAGSKGRAFPMDPGQIQTIFMTSIRTLRMYTQPLPDSCRVNVQKNQTLTVSGHIVKGKQSAHIANMQCFIMA